MKKNKSKSRPKSRNNSKDDSKLAEEQQKCCQVCRGVIRAQHKSILKCQECKRMIHGQCYASDFDTSRPFTCDMCTFKKKRGSCIICQQNGATEMLKAIDNSQGFVHVECALLASNVQVQSYGKLHFIKKQGDKQPTKLQCCGTNSSGAILNCVACSVKAHFRCWIVQFGEDYDYYLASRWLDKCQRYEFLLSYILSKKKSGLKGLIEQPLKSKENQILVCNKHRDTYPWCPCDNAAISNESQNPSYSCEQCSRYYHQPCSGLPPKSKQDFICKGCTQNDIFKKQLKLHQLLGEVSKVQKLAKWDDSVIRFLNAFPFKFSTIIQKKINDPTNLKQIQIYFARKYITKIFEKSTQDEKNYKKIVQILLCLQYGDKWKENQQKLEKKNDQSVKIIEQLSNLKKFGFESEVLQKIRQILSNIKPKQKKNKQIELFKENLKKFIGIWKNVANNSVEQLANSLKQLQLSYSNALSELLEQDKNFQAKFNHKINNQIYGALITDKASYETILNILNKYSRILFYQKEKVQISQQQYTNLTAENYEIIPKQDKQIYKWLMLRIKQAASLVNIKFQAIRKQQIVKIYQNVIKNKNMNVKALNKIQNESIKTKVCIIGTETVLSTYRMSLISTNVLKRKLIKMSSQKDDNMTETNFNDIPKIQNFLKKNMFLLTQNEKQSLQNYLGKLQFVSSILKRGEPFHYSIVQEKNYLNGSNPSQEPNILFLKLFYTFQKWDERLLPIQIMISQVFNKCVLRNVKFDKTETTEKLTNFVRLIISSLRQSLGQGKKITPSFLRKIVKVLKYLNIEGQYPQFNQKLIQVKQWAELFVAPQQIPTNISNFLQKYDKMQNLIKILDAKISSATEIDKVSLFSEKNKLSLLRQWCKLTQKMQLLAKSKPTINAVQTLKSLLDKSYYPHNSLYSKISQLEIESKTINKQVTKFLQKPRLPDHLDFHGEIKFISFKMTLQEGQSIRSLLQKCNLDVCVENQQLETQLKQFQSLPSSLGQFSEKKTLNQLSSLRRKLIDSCFKPDRLEEYEKFLRKIYVLKCLNFEGPTTRQQYYQLLSVGGVASLELQNKTADLLKAYKTIQKAQAQLLNPQRKRNYSNLIPWAEQRYKQIKQDLKFDPNQLNKLERARISNLKIRDQYLYLRSRRAQLDKYRQVETELLSSIFNNRDFINEFASYKLQLANLVKKVEEVIPYSLHYGQPLSSQNIFRRDKNILEAYLNIGIKHHVMQIFEQDCRNYRKSEQIRAELSLQNYRMYCDACSRVSDVGCKVPEFLNARSTEFFRMIMQVINSNEPRMQLYQVFISEGLQLRRLQALQKDRIFSMVIQIYQKIKSFSQNEDENDQQQDQSDQSGEDDLEDKNSNEEEDQQEEDQEMESMQDEMDQQQDFSRSDNQSPDNDGGNDGGINENKNTGNQIVLDDSD